MRMTWWWGLLAAMAGCSDPVVDAACASYDRYNLYDCTIVARNCEDDCDAAAMCRDEVGGTGCGLALQWLVDCAEEDSLEACERCRTEVQVFEDCLRGD